ncbi:gamma carbonic anhydrase family protein [Photorhabdus akhurstii]|uniref:gamma carbonic anhydrase family protein n=1 Tax=Photorhabdus akhurstii TaxID=171438 RepID=UPI001BD4CB7D|nr:gamma carbonic anhydrase family protein [Photorhabdus akhurstii]MBS9430714.1 gamma carbonic anhydrase family protein [Photorhabdus akhurstii]
MSETLRSYLNIQPKVGQNVMLDSSSVIIGDVRLADDVSIWPLVVIRGDVNYVSIGTRTNIQDGSILHVTHKTTDNPHGFPLIVGNDVTIGHKVILHGCTIGNQVLIGMGSILLDGSVIEDNVIVGAGSLVAPGKILESGYLYIGSPARQVRKLKPEELKGLCYSASHYVNLKNNYLQEDNM